MYPSRPGNAQYAPVQNSYDLADAHRTPSPYGKHAPAPYAAYAPYNYEPMSTPLKPMYLAQEHSVRESTIEQVQRLETVDQALKRRIRILRLVSRVLATGLSIAAFVPIAMTTAKFLTTKDVLREAPAPGGTTVLRGPWAKESKTWPTHMYLGIAVTSLVCNLGTMVGYVFGGVRGANIMAAAEGYFSMSVILGNLIVWIIAAAVYRKEKGLDGKNNDLWGWACSESAKIIQDAFQDEVPFDRYCNIQSGAWYAGLLQVAAMFLSGVVYLLTLRRVMAKKKLRRTRSELNGMQ
ncbi:hypothetical protein EJ06DRAFT_530774 [Trichodelitschia bisporula]|uniref:MARVEL domain-containing protein n=1 Tax=Trichodelitschia bisporula TaxID=703511 RepID=A0A6G1HW83_9PEZI|nr:hypothetical protein EJ06DRAFT_530774 [Trichodelitschia bisporula]